MPNQNKRIFMPPGRTNKEDRLNFIKFWVAQIKSLPDKDWSKQQNIVINSQLKNPNHKAYLALHKLKRVIN